MDIGVIGLGLIGGSIAKALQGKNGIDKIVAMTRNEKAITAALSEGIIQAGTTNDHAIFQNCSVVFICVPVGQIYEHVTKISMHCKGIITDAGSTKQGIMEKMKGTGYRFIGGHPMAGSERTGYFASNATLFENAVYILCPQEDSQAEDISTLKQLAKQMGAIPLVMDAGDHDKTVAAVSHLPHIEASALCLMAEAAGENAKRLAAGGFRDITRIASGSPEMWVDIALDASKPIAAILEEHIHSLQKVQRAVQDKDEVYLQEFFARAKTYRDALPAKGSGAVQGMPQLLLEVPDRPGVLRDVTAKLGDAGINIKDISIQNIREYEGGTLRLTVQDGDCAAKAMNLLTKAGYACRVV